MTFFQTRAGITTMIKFLYRFIYHFSLFLLFLPLQAAGLLLVPVGILLSRGRQKLPYLFRWFDNADLYIGRDSTTYLGVIQEGFLYRWYWLAIRNPVDYFSYKYLSITVGPEVKVISIIKNTLPWKIKETWSYYSEYEDRKVGDGDNEGLFYIEYLINNKIYYEYYFVKKLTATRCFRFRMGWKLGLPSEVLPGTIVDEVLSCTPVHNFSPSDS